MKGAEGRSLTLPFPSDVKSLSRLVTLDADSRKDIEKVSRIYPFRVPPFYASLMETGNPSCPIRLQAVPSVKELDGRGVADPLGEKDIAIVPSLFKRYPRRAVLLVTAECAMYCRFCNRRRLVGRGFAPESSREEALNYLEQCEETGEVILSGGDPLMADPSELEYVLERLRKMDHLRVIRISSRIPVVFPQQFHRHSKAIGRYGPLWFVVHINHPREVTPEFVDVIKELRRAGATVISQTVLLRGVNDCHHILASLFEKLTESGVKPYYLFQLDDVMGATHFKVRLETGLSIMRALRGAISGLCMPQYALDITGGLGKIPLENGYVGRRDGNRVYMENLYGQQGIYLDDGEESQCNKCGLCRK